MGFGAGLSGVAAANKDLQITGNNVANASTVGFKASRAEFGDAYTSTILGTGGDIIGSGVNVENVGQKFKQGNISQTDSTLDLAIDGAGFFILGYPNDAVTYTRAGIFGVDKTGFITNNQGARLQGFGVDENGVVTGILQDLQIQTGNQPPRGTNSVTAAVNVSAGAEVLQQLGQITSTNGLSVGVAQVGSPVATPSTLSTVGVPTTTGIPSMYNSDLPIIDRLTAGTVMPNIVSYSTPNTPNINSVVGGAAIGAMPAALAGLGPTDEITVNVINNDGLQVSATINPFVTPPTSIAEVIAQIQTAVNNNAALTGHVLLREDPALANRLQIYSTDGSTFPEPGGASWDAAVIDIPSGSASTLADLLGFGRTAVTGADNSANVADILLDPIPGVPVSPEDQIDINWIDSAGAAQSATINLTTADHANQTSLIAAIQAGIDADATMLADLALPSPPNPANSLFIVQQNPFNTDAIEIVPNVNDTNAAADPDQTPVSFANTTGSTLAQNLGLTSGSISNRLFQNPPDPTDTIQVMVQDPNLNGGTPYTALIRPFPLGNQISNTQDYIDSFQSALDNDPVLSGRINVRTEIGGTGELELISSTGTRILSVSDLVGTVAADSFLDTATQTNSIFSSLPTATPETIDITLQGPNINGGTQIVETIEPFPTGTKIDNMAELIGSFQAAIENNPELAGKIEIVEDPDEQGTLLIQAFGTYASDGTSILGVANNVGTLADVLGLSTAGPNVTINSSQAGISIFDNGGNIDLATVEGTPASVQGNLETGLVFNDFTPGTPTTLTGSTQTLPIFAGASGTIQLTVVSGSVSDDITINLPGGATGFTTHTQLENAVLVGLATSPVLNGVVTAGLDTSNRLVFSNTTTGANSISIFDAGGTALVSADGGTQLGLTANSSPSVTLELGTNDIVANNELTITVGGADPGVGTIRIPGTTYVNHQSVIDAINAQIIASPQLSGKVTAENVNNRIVFELTELGGFPNTLDVTSNSSALDAFGHSTQSTPPAIDPFDRRTSFRVNLSVPLPDEDQRSGSVEVELNENIRSIDQLASAINNSLNSAPEDEYIGVRAEVLTQTDGTKTLQFVATEAGEASQISISNIQAIGDDIEDDEIYALLQVDAFNNDLLEEGEPKVTNGYPEQGFVLYDSVNDVRRTITTEEDATASVLAGEFSQYAGMKATASTEVTLFAQDYINSGQMDILINGQIITANNYRDMVDEINQYQQTTLSGITAEQDEDTGDLILSSAIGTDIQIQTQSVIVTDSLTLRGRQGTAPAVLGGAADSETTALIGGTVEIILNEGYELIEPDPRVTGLFNGLTANSFEDYIINDFNPEDADTYNDTASLTVYDSLGNQHQMQMFFVKEPDDPQRPLDLNYWTVYAQVDGNNIGDPDPSLPYPDNLAPTEASFRMYFNADGTLDEESTGAWLISNWDPVDESGNSNGAFTSLNVAEGGSIPIPTNNSNSNFEINLAGSTQYGGPFSRNNFQQDGYSSGRLKDVEVGADGIIYARYTNGEAQVLGQVATASFQNNEGLNPLGHTEWAESFESGDPTIGEPGTGILGVIQSSALEDSTVDLSEQLVHLIIAQRNYQASAKTIETANAVTQTIINLR